MLAKLHLSRRQVLLTSLETAGTLVLIQNLEGVAMSDQTKPMPPKPPALSLDRVKEFVTAAHANFDRVKSLLAEEPALLNASWDWGGGDFETALGATGHMGRRDIALFLLEKGARMDIFVAVMLGELKLVHATLEAYPNLLHSLGPHGIPIMAHAKAGGDSAKAVLDYLHTLHPEKERE